ncbi:SGNH hydrolase domain-containing protein [Conexibacter sp. S30A1]|uniref:SGNH hydrolase domain-containing protein n=1 Tax=Conexibacter sp. S30A1 TaxID=2937800 RepID=UPI00200FF9EC|nr:SGNH hydrolase domain-containing protein [Conexibacter sp. S30A1]
MAPVVAAAALARAGAPIPTVLDPATAAGAGQPIASACLPAFGSGLSYQLCSLGDVQARHTVVLLGDSHASMWTPAFVRAARRLGFRLVPLAKPGCALWALHENRPGWPCLSWWRGVLGVIARLRPSATIVSFLTDNYTVAQAGLAARLVARVMRAVPHPVLLADAPSDDWYVNNVPTPAQCMAAPGANLARCALHLTPAIRASLQRIQAMVVSHGYPAIPTLQWFCEGDLCPTVIGGIVTSEDGNHITPQYAQALGPRLANRLRPILAELWRAEARAR